jgi:hypothetical protein
VSDNDVSYPADAGGVPYLLTVRGQRVPPTLDATRTVHNATAGAPSGVAAARSLGDLSHNVYSGISDELSGELLFLDLWNSLAGLGTFFAQKEVQEGAGTLFSGLEQVVWAPLDGFVGYHLTVPSGRSTGGLGLLRTTVSSLDKAATAFSAYTAATINKARAAGIVSHSVWARVPAPGGPPVDEIIAVDIWLDADDMNRYYDLGVGFEHLGPVFAGTPDTSAWRSAPGDWVEW